MELLVKDDLTHLLDELPSLKELTRYCTVEEIAESLQQIRTDLAVVRRRFEVWDAQSALQQGLIATADAVQLQHIHDELNRIELERYIASQSVSNLHRSCTHYRDLLAQRALQIVTEDMVAAGYGEPPLSYSLISVGSDGREEQTLITDQDYLIVYDDGGGDEADSWFVEFGNRLVDCLERIGFKRCTGDIMTSNPTWRGSYSQWRKRLFAIVRFEVEDFAKNMMDLIVLSDARHVAGNHALGEKLIDLDPYHGKRTFSGVVGYGESGHGDEACPWFHASSLDRADWRSQRRIQHQTARLGTAGYERADPCNQPGDEGYQHGTADNKP
jgi:hypothetical protein